MLQPNVFHIIMSQEVSNTFNKTEDMWGNPMDRKLPFVFKSRIELQIAFQEGFLGKSIILFLKFSVILFLNFVSQRVYLTL